jgi:twinkle protein
MNDTRRIKELLREHVMELAQYLFPNGKREGVHWCVGSINGEQGKSFKICIAGEKATLWGDFADLGRHSRSLLDLWMAARNVDFSTALREAAEWLGQLPPDVAAQSPRKPVSTVRTTSQFADEFLSREDCRRAIGMAELLRETPNLCKRIARARGRRLETIRELTREPSLGWNDGKLAFIYETGVKLRWRQHCERIVRWAFGKPWLWRGSFIDMARTIYLCEGETDAISLIDAGLESDGQTIAVALPSASTFNESWSQLFQGKHVILAFDADRAGEEATRRVSSLLYRHATSLKQLNWKGVQRAS